MMRQLCILVCLSICFVHCKTTQPTTVSDTTTQPYNVPIITWDKGIQDLGKVKRGETRDLLYTFTNTGDIDLIIDLVTACKCTSLDWPRKPIPPGKSGVISVTYDSTNQKLGPIKKSVDVIANTDPIVVEAFFKVDVIE